MANTEKFDQMATQYDNADRVHVANIASTAIKEALTDKSYKLGLDFGCGSGVVGLNLINNFDKVYFLDTSLNMLKVVDEKIKVMGVNNAETLLLDLEENTNINLDVKFDCIFMCQVLLHIPDHKLVIEKLKNLLSSNGTLVIVDFDKNLNIVSDLVHNGFNQDDLCKYIKSLGFSSVQSKNFYTKENLFMNQTATMFLLKADL